MKHNMELKVCYFVVQCFNVTGRFLDHLSDRNKQVYYCREEHGDPQGWNRYGCG